MYDLNQITYKYTVEVTYRFQGLDVIECLKNYGWRSVTTEKVVTKNQPKEKEMQEGKMVV